MPDEGYRYQDTVYDDGWLGERGAVTDPPRPREVSGPLGGRSGSFVLQGCETIEDGRIKATWFVVPGSGSEALRGLRGTGGFVGEFGKGSQATLDYWFA